MSTMSRSLLSYKMATSKAARHVTTSERLFISVRVDMYQKNSKQNKMSSTTIQKKRAEDRACSYQEMKVNKILFMEGLSIITARGHVKSIVLS